jgi:hypothetical protein
MKQHEIGFFLRDFKLKMDHFGIVFRDRDKNTETILDLGYTKVQVKEILRRLEIKDYVDGPEEDSLYKISPMWTFGRWIDNKEVYIKITIGNFNDSPVLISFHFSEHPLTYPFK